jgi:short-subunit dehydrogenase
LELASFGKVITGNADIAARDKLDRLLSEIHSKVGIVDLLLNSAGVSLPKPFLKHTIEDCARYLNLRFRSATRVTPTPSAKVIFYVSS